jgi:hypothetical protein
MTAPPNSSEETERLAAGSVAPDSADRTRHSDPRKDSALRKYANCGSVTPGAEGLGIAQRWARERRCVVYARGRDKELERRVFQREKCHRNEEKSQCSIKVSGSQSC